jgi:hypothetical protein
MGESGPIGNRRGFVSKCGQGKGCMCRRRRTKAAAIQRRQCGRRGLAVNADASAGSIAAMMPERSRAAGVRRTVNWRGAGAKTGRIQQKERDAEEGQYEFALRNHASLIRCMCKIVTTSETRRMPFGLRGHRVSRNGLDCEESHNPAGFRAPSRRISRRLRGLV